MELAGQLRNLRSGAPEVMKAFASIAQSTLATKALDRKTKELIALAVSVAVRCDDCIGFHVKAALEQGASQEEITEALAPRGGHERRLVWDFRDTFAVIGVILSITLRGIFGEAS
jgi:AhpD family alkylhydroperoxidase